MTCRSSGLPALVFSSNICDMSHAGQKVFEFEVEKIDYNFDRLLCSKPAKSKSECKTRICTSLLALEPRYQLSSAALKDREKEALTAAGPDAVASQ